MSGDDLTEFRDEMRRRGVYEKQRRVLTREERDRRAAKRKAQAGTRDLAKTVVAEAGADLDAMPVKRLAWAFGCAKTDSETEGQLYRALVRKVEKILAARKEQQ